MTVYIDKFAVTIKCAIVKIDYISIYRKEAIILSGCIKHYVFICSRFCSAVSYLPVYDAVFKNEIVYTNKS